MMGGARSTIVAHPQRAEIERQLRAGTPATHIARDFDLSRQAVSRHRVKLTTRPAVAGGGDRAALSQKLMKLFNDTKDLMTLAKTKNAPRAFLMATAEARKLLNAIERSMDKLDATPAAPAEVAVNVNTDEMRAIILAALAPFAKARQAVAKALVEHDAREAGAGE